ncbi:MAG: tRNA 2-selenouridine(34) synthase MnmH [Planctomycetota bacterium]|nr:MAG: tRNA 2-selenouridine(34) synthase MnmH [Planctomycetota bacterium]
MGLPSLSFAEARRLSGVRFIDLRAPGEHRVDAIPGSENLPLLDDQQRALVGTLYKRDSAGAALRWGIQAIRSRLPELLQLILGREVSKELWQDNFQRLSEPWLDLSGEPPVTATYPADPRSLGAGAIVLHCWRGGMRSRSMVALLQALGQEQCVHLEKGYKGYRAWVRKEMQDLRIPGPLLVLRGPTGVGKTTMLQRLETSLPGSTLDLEGLAQHRSSVLGDVALTPVGTKAFESRLLARLAEMGPPPWFVEGESRKVGNVVLPEALFQAMDQGIHIRLEASLEGRIRQLGEDYLRLPGALEEISRRLPFLENRLGKAWVGTLQAWLRHGRWQDVARVLLQRYYDPRYARSDHGRPWWGRIDVESSDAVHRLLKLRDRFLPEVAPPGPKCADSSALPGLPAGM